jgi:hypothetical protein
MEKGVRAGRIKAPGDEVFVQPGAHGTTGWRRRDRSKQLPIVSRRCVVDIPPSTLSRVVKVLKGVTWTGGRRKELSAPHVQVVLDGQDLGLSMEMCQRS